MDTDSTWPVLSGKLLLPSFGIEVDGIEVTRSAPRTEVFPEGDGIEDLICDSGDAFSISYLGPQSEATTVDRPFMGLDQACIRRVLLRVLDGEEYDDILLHYTTHYPREVKPGVPKGKPLDLRDLREKIRIRRPMQAAHFSRSARSSFRLPLVT